MFMGFAFLGGMILNLMPCVFPVLSIKAMSFAKNVGESSQKQRMDGVFYTLGVVVAFVTLASMLIALRAGGEAVGWAFRFSNLVPDVHCLSVFPDGPESVRRL